LQRQHFLASARTEGDAVAAACGLQRPERASFVRVGVSAVVDQVRLALMNSLDFLKRQHLEAAARFAAAAAEATAT
jgi:hypothetical protein